VAYRAKEELLRLVVVGSGIVGAGCGYAASRLGAEVTFVDAAAPGRATAAGAGVICPWAAETEDPHWYAFSCAAVREYPSLIASLGSADLGCDDPGPDDIAYRQVGALALASGDDELERIRRRVVARRAEAPEIGDVRILADGEAQSLFPPLRPGTRAVFIGGAARVDGRQLAAALIAAACRSGATIRTGWASLSCRAGRVTGVVVDGDLIEADAVVAATGAWTASFLEPAGITVRVTPQRGQIMHIGLGSADTGNWPVVLPSATGHYLLAFGGSRVVAGATREPDAGFDVRVTPGGLSEVLANALSVAPGLAEGTHLETRVGLRPASPDSRPLLGVVPGVAGLVIATGLGANGLTAGAYAGGVAARLALGLPPVIDLGPFDPLR
jgi:D-amino-acid dehydrogenase